MTIAHELQPLECRVLLAAAPVRLDVYPGEAGSYPSELLDVNGTLFFTANNGRHGRELWKSDGTAEGTGRVADIRPGRGGSNPHELTAVGATLFFTADDGVNGRGLWKSDGTPEGTVMVASGVNETFTALARVGDRLVLHRLSHRADGTVWSSRVVATDGTPSAPFEEWFALDGADPGPAREIAAVGDESVYLATAFGAELWRGGRSAGAQVLSRADLPRVPGPNISEIIAVGGNVFFAAGACTDHREDYGYHVLFATDGTSSGTVQLGPTVIDDCDSGPYHLAAVGETLFFDAVGVLWRSDGTAAGTRAISGEIYPSQVVDLDGMGFFVAYSDGGTGLSLWRSNGTREETFEVLPLTGRLATNEDWEGQPQQLTSAGDALFYTADDGTHGRELWMVPMAFASLRSDGVLHIEGTDGDDNVSLIVRDSTLRVWRDGHMLAFPVVDVSRIEIDTYAGDDVIDWTGISMPTYCFGGLGNDRMTAGLGNDTLSGGAGRDYLSGGGGDDFISGGATNDELYGGPGADHLTGGDANDLLFGGPHNDRIYGDAGTDVLVGNAGNDTMYAGDGDDELTGGAGWDLHSGQGGNDRLFARDGRDDELDGGEGDDAAEHDPLFDVLLAVEASSG